MKITNMSAKYVRFIILILFIGSALYFWNSANNWEQLLQNDWVKDPALANASATLEYLKALVKIVMSASVAMLAMQCLKNSSTNS